MSATCTATTNRLPVVLTFLVAVLLVGCIFLGWQYGWRHLEVMFADEQTQIFDEMRSRALQALSVGESAGCLQYAVHYYPSGTKQSIGTPLDRIVERHRASVVRDIIAHLRQVTGHDLGDDPKPWIEAYGQGS